MVYFGREHGRRKLVRAEGEDHMASSERYLGRSIRVFLSYSTSDKEIAGNIRWGLEELGVEAFLAHEDISPSAEWQDVILENLRSCDVFVPILTRHFHNSNWTDQETGVAICLQKLIIPLKIDANPYGFIGKYQALKFDLDKLAESCWVILSTIDQHKAFKEAVRDCVIRAFVDSHSYEDAKKKSSFLLYFDSYGTPQLDEIMRGSSRNRQIYESFGAQNNLRTLISRFEEEMDKSLIEEYRKKLE